MPTYFTNRVMSSQQAKWLERYGMKRDEAGLADLWILESRGLPTFLALTRLTHARYVVGIPNFIQLAGKAALWANLAKSLGREAASDVVPASWPLLPGRAKEQIGECIDTQGMVLLKGDRQKREALCVVARPRDIPVEDLSRFKLVQRVVWPLHQVFGRCYSLRFWLFLAIRQGIPTWSVFYRVRVIYAANGEFISSNAHYSNDMPLYTEQISQDVMPRDWHSRAVANMDLIIETLRAKLSEGCHQGSVYADLFGVDVVLDAQGKPFILEFNRNPSLAPLNEEDARVKEEVMEWFFENLLGLGARN